MEGISQAPQYSKEFLTLIDTKGKEKTILEGSCVSSEGLNIGEAFADWERGRKFIAETLKKDGTILDYGCANGFLLRCLQEWSKYKLDPYGVENDKERLAQAKELFSEIAGHFVMPEDMHNLPKEFDQVYWAVGDNLTFTDEDSKNWINNVRALAAKDGRLILGFYDSKEENMRKIEALKSLGVGFSMILENPNGGNEVIAYLDT